VSTEIGVEVVDTLDNGLTLIHKVRYGARQAFGADSLQDAICTPTSGENQAQQLSQAVWVRARHPA
jgi:hypothetical protein